MDAGERRRAYHRAPRSLSVPSFSLATPFQVSAEHPDYSTHKLLLGTHTAAGEQNYLMQATVSLPLPDTEIDAKRYDDERGEVGMYGLCMWVCGGVVPTHPHPPLTHTT